jgi:hypothetical protein
MGGAGCERSPSGTPAAAIDENADAIASDPVAGMTPSDRQRGWLGSL